MNNNQIAPHEILELHELLSENIIGAKKISANMNIVQDENLKTFMKDSLNGKKAKIQELQNFINSSVGIQNNNQVNQNNQGSQNNQGNNSGQ